MAFELITIDNLNFKYYQEVHDTLWSINSLGMQVMEIPNNIIKNYRKDKKLPNILPHYSEWDLETGKVPLWDGSTHACSNSDTQIVLMNHLFNKRRRYELNYVGMDSFWLFHDSRHAVSDVYHNEVNFLTSHIELQRLYEGLELANKHGKGMRGATLHGLVRGWLDRWNAERSSMQKFDTPYFYKRLTDYEKYIYDTMDEFGFTEEEAYQVTEYDFEQELHLIDD